MNWRLLVITLLGICLIIASGCVFNNILDRKIDIAMVRTKNRALVTGRVATWQAIIFGSILSVTGFLVLALQVNILVVFLGIFALLMYVVVYGLAKRRTVHGTLVGSIPGALPPVAGYCAVTGRLDIGAVLLFLVLVVWQMPHFYAIAMYRLDDYKAAGIPVLPSVMGLRRTKIEILSYILAFIVVAALLTFYSYANYIYLVVVTIFGVTWLALGIQGFNNQNDKRWARTMFFFSLVVLLTFSVMVSFGTVIS